MRALRRKMLVPRRTRGAKTTKGAFIRREGIAAYGAFMRFATGVDEPVARLADRFVRLVAEGRGDGARGRNLYALRCLDAMASPDSPLHLPYRPTRNPGAFLAMVFDLAGAVIHGYLARIDGGAEHTRDAVGGVRQHLGERLSAPWSRFAAELHGAGFEGLAALVCETAWQALHRPAVSDLPALLAEVRGSMTTSQWARFDADQYVRELPFHRVLTLLRYHGEHDVTAGTRELHPAGGDLRALVRRRLDAPWRLALERRAHSDPIAFVASWPVDVGWLADQAADEDFAVAYTIATDANHPGRSWAAPPPYVGDEDREGFESLVGRDASAAATRRETHLRRWGVSATFPASVRAVDEALVEAANDLPAFHAGAAWREHVIAHRDALEVARRRFVQQVADTLATEARHTGAAS